MKYDNYQESMTVRILAVMVGLVVTSAFLQSCAVIKSQPVGPQLAERDASAGYYFLPKGKIRIIAEKNANKPCTLELKESVYEPDPKYFFSLEYDASINSDDKVTVDINPKGLLSSINVETHDKTGEILVKVAEAIKEGIKAAASVGFEALAAPEEEFKWNITFSPDEDISQLNKQLKDKACPQLAVVPPNTSTSDTGIPSLTGIYFRPVLGYELSFTDSDNAVLVKTVVYLPNRSPLLPLSVSRSAFVKRITNIQFDNGIVKQVTITKPSELESFMNIPVSVAKTIASIPAELIQLKVNLTTESKNLLDARKAELQARQQLLEADEELSKLRKELAEAKKNEP